MEDFTDSICFALLAGSIIAVGSKIRRSNRLTLCDARQCSLTIRTGKWSLFFAKRLELEAIAAAGGGSALNAGSESELDRAFNQILNSLSISLVE